MDKKHITESYDMELRYTVTTKPSWDDIDHEIKSAIATFSNHMKELKVKCYIKKIKD